MFQFHYLEQDELQFLLVYQLLLNHLTQPPGTQVDPLSEQ